MRFVCLTSFITNNSCSLEADFQRLNVVNNWIGIGFEQNGDESEDCEEFFETRALRYAVSEVIVADGRSGTKKVEPADRGDFLWVFRCDYPKPFRVDLVPDCVAFKQTEEEDPRRRVITLTFAQTRNNDILALKIRLIRHTYAVLSQEEESRSVQLYHELAQRIAIASQENLSLQESEADRFCSQFEHFHVTTEETLRDKVTKFEKYVKCSAKPDSLAQSYLKFRQCHFNGKNPTAFSSYSSFLTSPALVWCKSLTIINLRQIKKFPSSLELATQLSELKCAHLRFVKVDWMLFAAVLANLPQLKSLTLDDCNLRDFPDVVMEAVSSNLQRLQLSNNKLTRLTSTVGRLRHLRELDLGGNVEMKDDGMPWTNLPRSLESLRLDGTAIKVVPAVINEFSVLQRFSARDCKLTKFPWNHISLLRPSSLKVRQASLRKSPKIRVGEFVPASKLLPSNVPELDTELFVSGDGNLPAMPSAWEGARDGVTLLFDLTVTNAGWKHWCEEQLPPWTSKFYLSGCTFACIPNLHSMHLTSLSLVDCGLTELDWRHLPSTLTLVDFSRNSLTKVCFPEKSKTTNLACPTTLNLSHNLITSLVNISSLKSFSTLSLCHNRLRELPMDFGSLFVADLDLSRNLFQPEAIGNFGNLKSGLWQHLARIRGLLTLSLRGNKLEELPCAAAAMKCAKLDVRSCDLRRICPRIDCILDLCDNPDLGNTLPFVPAHAFNLVKVADRKQQSNYDKLQSDWQWGHTNLLLVTSDAGQFRDNTISTRLHNLKFQRTVNGPQNNLECRCCACCGTEEVDFADTDTAHIRMNAVMDRALSEMDVHGSVKNFGRRQWKCRVLALVCGECLRQNRETVRQKQSAVFKKNASTRKKELQTMNAGAATMTKYLRNAEAGEAVIWQDEVLQQTQTRSEESMAMRLPAIASLLPTKTPDNSYGIGEWTQTAPEPPYQTPQNFYDDQNNYANVTGYPAPTAFNTFNTFNNFDTTSSCSVPFSTVFHQPTTSAQPNEDPSIDYPTTATTAAHNFLSPLENSIPANLDPQTCAVYTDVSLPPAPVPLQSVDQFNSQFHPSSLNSNQIPPEQSGFASFALIPPTLPLPMHARSQIVAEVLVHDFAAGVSSLAVDPPTAMWRVNACAVLRLPPLMELTPTQLPFQSGYLSCSSVPCHVLPMPHDEHSAFRALSYLICGCDEHHSTLRTAVLDFIREHEHRFSRLRPNVVRQAEWRHGCCSHGRCFPMEAEDLIAVAALLTCTVGVFLPDNQIHFFNEGSLGETRNAGGTTSVIPHGSPVFLLDSRKDSKHYDLVLSVN